MYNSLIMDYDIITTLGPASDQPAVWAGLLEAGATAFRLNTSHLSLLELRGWLERLAPFLHANPIPLVLDLQGSKWRLGSFTQRVLNAGEQVTLTLAETSQEPEVLPVPHADFFHAAPLSNGEVVMNDAKVRLRVEETGAQRVRARVTLGGVIAPRKGITFAASAYRSETLSAKDRSIIEETAGRTFVRYAVSYVKDALEMERYRGLFPSGAVLIAKLEREQAMAEARAVAGFADALWVCRGDLGAELGLAGMARAVRQLTAGLREIAVPVSMAGQVLEHMTGEQTPTRSEVCYLYDTLMQGYSGFVLSDETAIGRYPLESCRAAALFRA